MRQFVNDVVEVGNPVDVLSARQRSFDQLLAFARSHTGSLTYTRDVIGFVDELQPTLGSRMAVPQSILTVDAMLGALHETNEGRRAEVIATVQRERRGDRSALVVEIERHLQWDGLPAAAREALLEAEARFQDGRTIDHAPNVVSVAKAVEVTLLAEVFRPLRDSLTPVERRRLATDGRANPLELPLRRYLADGRAVTLGDMMHVLRRIAGPPSATPEIDPLALVRRHLALEERLGLVEPEFVERVLDLVRQRNAAAHTSKCDRSDCAKARSSALYLLAAIIGTRQHARERTTTSGPSNPPRP